SPTPSTPPEVRRGRRVRIRTRRSVLGASPSAAWQAEPDTRAAGPGVGADAPTPPFHELLDDGKADPRAPTGPVARLLDTVEPFEHVGQVCGRDGIPGVGDAHE